MNETRKIARPRVAVVLGPWSSGTSAVAQAVMALGANGHPPFTRLNDPQTPVSGESRTLRRIFAPHFDHTTLTRTGTPRWASARLRAWAGPGLSVAKLPILAWFLPEVMRAWDARVLIVRRSAEAIEATRVRRDWPAVYGAEGARHIYRLIGDTLPRATPRLDVDFERLKADPGAVSDHIATFLDLPLDPLRVAAVIRQ